MLLLGHYDPFKLLLSQALRLSLRHNTRHVASQFALVIVDFLLEFLEL